MPCTPCTAEGQHPSSCSVQSWNRDCFYSSWAYLSNSVAPPHTFQAGPMGSKQVTQRFFTDIKEPSCSPSALPPYLALYDHLERPMSRGALRRSASRLKPHQFDTNRRRLEYAQALATKAKARRRRKLAHAETTQLVSISGHRSLFASPRPVRRCQKSSEAG